MLRIACRQTDTNDTYVGGPAHVTYKSFDIRTDEASLDAAECEAWLRAPDVRRCVVREVLGVELVPAPVQESK